MNPSFDQALQALPHGAEFRFIDRLTALDPGKSGAAEYTLKGDEPFLKGHFPGQPLMPGVLLLEAIAQLAGVVAQSDPNIPPLPNLKLTAIRNAKILGAALPGETLQITALLVGRLGNLIQAEGAVTLNGAIIGQTHVTLSGAKA